MDIAAGIGALQGAFSLAQSLRATLTKEALNEIKIGLQEKIVAAQAMIAALQTDNAAALRRVDDLEREIAEMKRWARDAESYELKRYYPGVFAYAHKPGVEGAQAAMKLCARCYDRGEKGILQATERTEMRSRVHRCNNCGGESAFSSEMS